MKKNVAKFALVAILTTSITMVSLTSVSALWVNTFSIPQLDFSTTADISTGWGSATGTANIRPSSGTALPGTLRARAGILHEGRFIMGSQVTSSGRTSNHFTSHTVNGLRQNTNVRGLAETQRQDPYTNAWSSTALVQSSANPTIRTVDPFLLVDESLLPSSPAGRPDLIPVWTSDFEAGWARSSDINVSYYMDERSRIEWEAMARERQGEILFYVDVYGDDFVTVIGQFAVQSPIVHSSIEEMRADAEAGGVRIPENASEGEVIRAFQEMLNARGASEYLATLGGAEMLTIYEMQVEVETAGARLPRMATEHDIRVAFVQARSHALNEKKLLAESAEIQMSYNLPIAELDNAILEAYE